MPGRDPREAVFSFMEPFNEAIAVLDSRFCKFFLSNRGGWRKETPYSWVLNGEDGMELTGGWGTFHATMMFKVVDCDPEKNEQGYPYRVTTLGYNYKLVDGLGVDRIRFHWHPLGRGGNQHPHIHALPDLNAHVYLPRVTFEAAIRTCIEAGAPLTVDAAEAIRHLAVTEAPHMLYRSWSDWPPGQEAPFGATAP